MDRRGFLKNSTLVFCAKALNNQEKLANINSSPQKKGAAKRALKKVARRIDTVKGQIIYWKLRVAGESHFKANLEMNEYWASCKKD